MVSREFLSHRGCTVVGMSDGRDHSKNLVVLLGGGIGAGKSCIADVFVQQGFTVIKTDEVGHSVLAEGSSAVVRVSELWPDAVESGVVDRQELARVVFRDAHALEQLEAITHPEIRRRVLELVEAAPGLVVIEIPLTKVFASESYLRVAVIADSAIREERAVGRGGDRADVRRRIANQPTDAEWRHWADHVIDNSNAWAATRTRAESLLQEVVARG